MPEVKRSVGLPLGRRLYTWLIMLTLVLVAHACGTPDEPETDSILSSPNAPATATASLVSETATVPTTSTLPAPALASALPTVVPQPVAVSTPFPDEQEIVSAILGQGGADHWVTHVLTGSFTAPGADERLALVGNIGDLDEIRWVVIGQTETEGDWRLLGVSEWLGSGFDVPPSFYLPPDLLDFDGDGQQELLNHYSRVQRGWTTSADILYRWDGHALARIWRADTISDNTLADNQDVPQSYRESYQAEWEWVDLDGDALDEILLRGHVTFYSSNLGEETWERMFHWDGKAFQPYVPDGPAGTFAYTVMGDLWLWQDRIARPLGVGNVREFHWSPDGLKLTWWAKLPVENDDSQVVNLGIYDLAADTRREFSLELEGEFLTLHWIPDGRLVYTVLDQAPTLLDPETGRVELLPVEPFGTWSPDGNRVAYERDGNLYVYDLTANEERALVVAPEGAKAPKLLPAPIWSPRGDWIAYYLANEDSMWVGLVSPNLSEPLSGFGILETFDGREAPMLELVWSPGGSRLAVLTSDPGLAQQPSDWNNPATVLYVAELPPGEGYGIGLPDWTTVLQLETMSQDAGLAWSPDGERVALVVESEVWEVPISGEATLRRRFSIPELEWTTLEWAPDGRGFLVGGEWVYDEHLYWFPSDGTDPVLLLADSLGIARWSPQAIDVLASSGMVMVEYTESVPLLHFVGEDGADVVVPAKGAEQYTPFHIGGDRVYYNKAYADRNEGVSLFVSDALAGCRPPLTSPDASRLAWLCDDGVPDWSDLISGTAEINFRLMVTDDRGRNPREAWSYVETGPDYRNISLVSWRRDGGAIYLSRPKYGTAWAYFDYNPGILTLDLSTSQITQIGDLDGVHDGLVSPDGTWLVQSKIVEWPSEGVFLTLQSLVDGTERTITSAEGATVAGDFSFSPDNTWLAWREWTTAPGASIFLIRVLRLPDGESLTVYGDAELTAPQIGGWLGKENLVLVYPPQEDGTGG
ncbi:MAG: hypothetical protein V3S14_03335, partial [Anaerolineae bacterium]